MPSPFSVSIKPRVLKGLSDLPEETQGSFFLLEDVLRTEGPAGPHNWKNFGVIRGKGNQRLYHCHISKDHRYVVCWEYFKESIRIEIYYAGPHPTGKYPTNRP
jgi:mRNA-degrading endonuclease RelE of RelBE toxin-antitoxin system